MDEKGHSQDLISYPLDKELAIIILGYKTNINNEKTSISICCYRHDFWGIM